MSKKEYTVIEILDILRRRKQGDGTRMIAKAADRVRAEREPVDQLL